MLYEIFCCYVNYIGATMSSTRGQNQDLLGLSLADFCVGFVSVLCRFCVDFVLVVPSVLLGSGGVLCGMPLLVYNYSYVALLLVYHVCYVTGIYRKDTEISCIKGNFLGNLLGNI